MVEVEIRTPVYDEEEGRIGWRELALVRADGGVLTIYSHGDRSVVRADLPVVDMHSGERILGNDDPERWARNLPYAYRAGDLVAVLLLDSSATTDPASSVAAPPQASHPTIPSPPEFAGMALSA